MTYSGRMGLRNTSKRLPRHLRSEDLPRDVFTPRTYQVELLDSAQSRNTIIFMGSSSGRMFIAVMLMKEMSEQIRKPLDQGGKCSIYLVSSDETVDQQSSSIQHPANFALGIYTSKQGALDWPTDKWTQEIQKSEVLIMTGELFLHLLQKSILTYASINLLIIDDCHLVLQDHPYKEIMSLYKSAGTVLQPRVLGLTSNILQGQLYNPENLANLVFSLEDALQSTAETSTLVISERYGLRCTEQVLECEDYEDTLGLNDELYILLENAIDFLEECNIKPTEELDNRDPCQIPRAALIECHNILTQLGPWCAACLADMLVTQIEKIEKQKETNALHKKFFKLGATTLRMVSTIFDKHFKQCEYSVEELLKYSTPKVTKLMNCLRKYRPEMDFIIVSEELDNDDIEHAAGSDSDISDDDDDDMDLTDNEDDADSKKATTKQVHVAVKKLPPADDLKQTDPFSLEEDKYLCGIVFVEHQHEAFALNKFIEEVCSWDEGLCFVKSNHLTAAKSTVKKDKKLYKKQEEVLRKFRMQELNLLVSTSVLEEGVDIPKCNLVVRFDAPKSYRSYSQSKGRARARDAEYIILIEGEHIDEFNAQLKVYKEIEEVLIRQCNKTNEDSTNEVVDSSCDTVIEPYIPSSMEDHIKVTLDTSIMLVNRYCAKLPSDAFTHLTPACTIIEIQHCGQAMYKASLRLPINSPIKNEVEGAPMSTKLKARQAVALKMCEILHKEGELDDHLMPVGKEMFQGDDWEEEEFLDDEEDPLGEARPGTTKRKQYYVKKVASALLQSHPVADTPCYLYIINMTLTGAITEEQNTRGRKIYAPEDTPRGFGILTSKPIPLVPMFPVFTRSGEVTVSIALLREGMELSEPELERLKMFHRFLFSNVLRLEKDPMDYQPPESTMGYVVVPLNQRDERSPIEIDWEFTDKVEKSNGMLYKSRQPGEEFEFKREDFEDAVVMPSYRNIDQPQYFYVAEIRSDLNPVSPFPSPELYKTFAEYYTTKYGLTITNMDQPLLDVDHTSARLNLLIPRYMNQKGVPLPTSSAETKKARRENLQQKQILVPELCDIHVFLASLWKKAVCLPAILYRMNYLLLSEEIRKHVAKETKIGISELTEGYRFPKLDFGFDTSPESLRLATIGDDTDNDKGENFDVDSSDDKDDEDNDDNGDDDEEDENQNDQKEKKKDEKQTSPIDESVESEDESKVENKKDLSANRHLDLSCSQPISCDTKPSNANISETNAATYDSDTATFAETKCNMNNDAKPIEIGKVEFDIYARDENLDKKFCDKPHPFLDPTLSIQGAPNGANQNGGTGSAADSWDSMGCELCNIANQDIGMMGITDLVLTSCPNCAKLKSDDKFDSRPKIVEIFEDNTAGSEKSKISQNNLKNEKDLLNGFTDLEISPRDNCQNNCANDLPLENGLENDRNENNVEQGSKHDEKDVSKDIKESKLLNDQTVEIRDSDSKLVEQNGECANEIEQTLLNKKDIVNNGQIDDKEEICCSNTDLDNVEPNNDVTQPGVEKAADAINTQSNNNDTEKVENIYEDKALVDDVKDDSNTDIFSNIGKFIPDKKNKVEIEEKEDVIPEPLISLDQDVDLATFIGPSPCDILQALTMSNANDFFSLERLETIGDSFLKYAITVYLYCSYPGIHEGKLSYLRSKQVSNYNLYRLGKRKGLSECMISTKFEPYENWLPPGFVINECKRKGPVPKVHVATLPKSSSTIFLSQMFENALKNENTSDTSSICLNHKIEMKNFSRELEEIDQITRAKDEEFSKGDKSDSQQTWTPYSLQLHQCLPDKSIADCVEALIGCYLTSCDKMAALLFMSWMGLKVLPRKAKTASPDEIEFDRLPCPQSPFLSTARGADLILARQLEGYEAFEEKVGYTFRDRSYLLQAFTHASYHYNTVTDCYQRLEFLGDAVLDYVITRHLYEDSDKYSPGVLTDLRSALVNNNIFAALAVKWDFHKYFKAISPALFNVIEKFVARQKDKEDEIDIEDDETDEDHEQEHVELEVPKALGDIFESVAGAIYLDSGMSLDVVWGVFYKIMKPQIDKYLKNIPKSPVRELLEQEPETAKFDKPERTMDGKIRVTVNVVGKGVFTGIGRNYRIAKSASAKKALRCIKTLEAEGLV